MARLRTFGFELEDNGGSAQGSVDGSLTGTTLETTVVRSGAASRKVTSGVGQVITNVQLLPNPALGTTVFVRYYFQFATLPSATVPILRVLSGVTQYVSARLTSAGNLQLWNDAGAQIGSDSATTISTDTWYRIELSCLINTGSTDAAELRLDGVSVASTTGASFGDALIDTILAGWLVAETGPKVLYLDDVAINDSTGASQNSFPGSGKVVLLKPISDSAVGTGWTLGTGTAISANSGSTAVKNIPPLGVADLTAGSDTKQIRNATANANSNYDATLQTYATAGISAGDTINVVTPIVATGAPVSTSAKLGTIGITTNPAIANVALSAAGTSGAFWSGNAANTYDGSGVGWKWSYGTTTYNPSVTLASSPVARVTQVTSSTRIAMVCFVGMYVDYTPAVVATVMPPRPTVVLQAVNRASRW